LSEGKPEACSTSNQEDYCPSQNKPTPDLLAVYSGEAVRLKEQLESMGLEELDRFAHCINGWKVGSFQFGNEVAMESSRHVNLLSSVDLSLEDMVLFAKPALAQR
jgi:hypothetical protein